MSKSIFVVAAHPDDEVLGCGGTIARYAHDGVRVNVAFISDGVSSREGVDSGSAEFRAAQEARRTAAYAACGILGANIVFFGAYSDNRLDSVPLLDVIKTVEALFAQHRPEIVFTHHAHDLNVDHRLVHQAVETACRPCAGGTVKTAAFFEVPSSTEWRMPGNSTSFAPNWYVDISAWLDRKLRALEAYAVEVRDWPHPRSMRAVEYLARWRGATVGVDAAESYVIGRQIS
ncbi:MAG TPA: PIG-L deacetylase family protein [Steroidobacteraceae bacterium]|nr:PIG-L deacetylase family protein [Steroidobacteraceae bacterium]